MAGDGDATAPRRTRPSQTGLRTVTATYFGAQYRVERTLGSGGMGSVFLARDELLDRWVAIKVLLPEVAELPGARDRFRAEARAMARIRHPQVVGVHSFGEERGLPYLVMEHVPGEPLHRALAKRGVERLRLDAAIAIADQLCRGVSAIHAAGLVHRDLKPANVMLGPAGRLAITDLGLASAIRDPRSDETWATPGYAAPEILLEDPPSAELRPRADVFAIAVIVYELLTGRLPFASEIELARASLAPAPVIAASAVVPELPPAIDLVLAEALAFDPARRTRSADALRRSLLDAADRARTREAAPRIVLADDDRDYRFLAESALRDAIPDARIEVCADGASALAAARRERPALVVSDLDMPVMDGPALIAALHREPVTRGVPVLVASACGSSNDWALLCRIGADGFVGKPFEPQQLGIAARGLLDAR